jgi:hypothetical protein
MKEHHLDVVIKSLKISMQMEPELRWESLILILLEEIKRLDQQHESLSNWVYDYEE